MNDSLRPTSSRRCPQGRPATSVQEPDYAGLAWLRDFIGRSSLIDEHLPSIFTVL
jgi:hypothetical protein